MASRSGASILLDIIADEGVTHIFGNPGSTELPLIDALADRPALKYVHVLQENSAVGMADGYSRVTRRPAFVNLHTLAGLGGGAGNLTNALWNGAPLVVTAGQQDQRHLVDDPILSGDLVGLAHRLSKWGHEVRSVRELGTITRRAFRDAMAPPLGPVFLSLPVDVLDELTEIEPPTRSYVLQESVAAGIEELAELLRSVQPDRLALVVGDEVAAEDAVLLAEDLAGRLGVSVFGAPFCAEMNFPTDSVLWQGQLPVVNRDIARRLQGFDLVFLIGAPAFTVYPFDPASPLPALTRLAHLSSNPAVVARSLPVDFGTTGSIAGTLRALSAALGSPGPAQVGAQRALAQAQSDRADRLRSVVADRSSERPMHPMVAVDAVVRGAGPETTFVDEAVTAGGYLRGFVRTRPPGSYLFSRGAGLGWGMPAAIGAQLGRPEVPTVCAIGDGASMYSIQALWTASHHRVPVTFVVLDNRQYRILRDALVARRGVSVQTNRFVAMDIDDPPLDIVAIGEAMGVPSLAVEDPDDLRSAVERSIRSDTPSLIVARIAGGASPA